MDFNFSLYYVRNISWENVAVKILHYTITLILPKEFSLQKCYSGFHTFENTIVFEIMELIKI